MAAVRRPADLEEPVPSPRSIRVPRLRGVRVLLAASVVVLGAALLDGTLPDALLAVLVEAGLGRTLPLALATALPGTMLLGWLLARGGALADRPRAAAGAPPRRSAVPAARLLLRQQARHHTGTVLALRL